MEQGQLDIQATYDDLMSRVGKSTAADRLTAIQLLAQIDARHAARHAAERKKQAKMIETGQLAFDFDGFNETDTIALALELVDRATAEKIVQNIEDYPDEDHYNIKWLAQRCRRVKYADIFDRRDEALSAAIAEAWGDADMMERNLRDIAGLPSQDEPTEDEPDARPARAD